MDFFEGTAEEVAAEINRRKDLFRMETEVAAQDQVEFIDGLTEHQLTVLKKILIMTIGDENDAFAHHTLGWVQSVAWQKFQHCLACGKKHDDTIPTDGMDDDSRRASDPPTD